jgi:hypothetical protein
MRNTWEIAIPEEAPKRRFFVLGRRLREPLALRFECRKYLQISIHIQARPFITIIP